MEHLTIDLPEDILFEILSALDIVDFANLAKSSIAQKYILSKPRFLNHMAIVHGLPFSETTDQLLSYSKLTPQNLMVLVIENEDIRVINRLIEHYGGWFSYDSVMILAAEGGHQSIVDDMLSLGADNYRLTIASAAGGGHRSIIDKIIKVMIDSGYDHNKLVDGYNAALVDSARGGHQDIVNQMLDLGANNYEWALVSAAEGGYLDIVNQMLDLGRDSRRLWHLGRQAFDTYVMAMEEAAKRGYQNILNTLLVADEYTRRDYIRVMDAATEGGHHDIANQMSALIDRNT